MDSQRILKQVFSFIKTLGEEGCLKEVQQNLIASEFLKNSAEFSYALAVKEAAETLNSSKSLLRYLGASISIDTPLNLEHIVWSCFANPRRKKHPDFYIDRGFK